MRAFTAAERMRRGPPITAEMVLAVMRRGRRAASPSASMAATTHQFANRFVIGGELDWGKSSSSRDEHIFGDSALLSGFGAFGAARLRAGYAFDRLLAYGAVGVGFASISNGYRYTIQKGCDTLQQAVWDEQVKAGLIAGGGFEYAFTKHFVGRGEYLYADYGSVTLTSRTARGLNSATRCISCASAPATGSDAPLKDGPAAIGCRIITSRSIVRAAR